MDEVEFHGESMDLLKVQGTGWFSWEAYGLPYQLMGTNCRRGFHAHYRIRDGGIYLGLFTLSCGSIIDRICPIHHLGRFMVRTFSLRYSSSLIP